MKISKRVHDALPDLPWKSLARIGRDWKKSLGLEGEAGPEVAPSGEPDSGSVSTPVSMPANEPTGQPAGPRRGDQPDGWELERLAAISGGSPAAPKPPGGEGEPGHLDLARESLRLAEVGYREGVDTQLDVLAARTSVTEARQKLSGAQRDHRVALARLWRSQGILVDQALKAR